MTFSFQNFLQYYLEKNLDARAQELEREAELEEKAPKAKAKSKMSKVRNSITLWWIRWIYVKYFWRPSSSAGREGSKEEAENAGLPGS